MNCISMAKNKESNPTIAQNKKAYHDYFVEETFEAGISLFGTEVKGYSYGNAHFTVRKGKYI